VTIPRADAGTTASPTERCPCGRASYDTCCGRLHRRAIEAATAEQLMRSRYSAFARNDASYLLHSWHPTTRPARIPFDPELRWIRLEILDTSGGNLLDTEGAVEFDAHHLQGDRYGVLHERSVFIRFEKRWVYVGPVAANVT
jgi:SEC-C motif-containing protein